MSKNPCYQSDFFSLDVSQTDNQSNIIMYLFLPVLNTRHIPYTVQFLKKYFPSVLKTQCFNGFNLPFIKEVESTEIGHLFEHILLDQLCILKLENGHDSAIYNGNTSWNWERDPEGVFHITIDVGEKESRLFIKALRETINLMELLLLSLPYYPASVEFNNEYFDKEISTGNQFRLPVEDLS